MSAWIVSKNHIDVLITAALAWELIVQEQADEKGRMLWKECQTSVAYRYPDDGDGDWPGPIGLTLADIEGYRFTAVEGVVDPEVVYHAARSLSYQSCEHQGWLGSRAQRLVVEIEKAALELTPAHRQRYGPGTRDAFVHGDSGGWSADSPRIFQHTMELRQIVRAGQ